MEHVLIPYAWKEFVFHRVCSFKIYSILENGLTAEGKQNKEWRQTIFFTPSTLSGQIQMKKHPVMTSQCPRKCTITAIGNMIKIPRIGEKLSRAQDQGFRFWQTKSSAIIVHNPVPANCIYKVISQNGHRTLFERISTPRPAPKVTLGCNWQSQQQQLSDSASPSSRTLRLGLRIGMSKALRQTQVQSFPGNWSGIQFHLLTKSPNSKSIFEWKECLKMPSWKTKNRWKKSTKKVGEVEKWIMHKVRSWRLDEKKWYDLQWRIKSRDLRDGQPGVDRTETNLGNGSVSFLPETRTRGIERVSMCRLAPTKSRHDEQDQSQIWSFDNAILSFKNSFTKKKARTQSMATRPCESRRRKTRNNVATIPRHWADGRTTRFSDLLSWRSGGLKLTSSSSNTSPRLTSPPKKSFWKHDLHEKWRYKTPSRTIVEKRRLQNNIKWRRVANRRMPRPKVVGEMEREDKRRFMFN